MYTEDRQFVLCGRKSIRMEKISVIVPVYQVEPYLHLCIDSILAQTYENFELILVDDGSPDNCGAICDEYAAKDNRIIVIHQENGGLSAARNTGLDWVFANSHSRWITFVDSDDALAPIMLETLYQEAVSHGADMAVTRGAVFSEEGQLEKEGRYVGPVSCYSGKDLLKPLYGKNYIVSVMAWGKLVRRELYRDLRFPVGKIHEDEATTPILLFHARKVVVIRSWLYYYRQREGSIVHAPFSAKRFDAMDALASCAAYFESHGGGPEARLLRKEYKRRWARVTITARREGVYHQVPSKYRMPLPRALGILLIHSLCRGGAGFAKQRLRNLANQRKP